MLNDCADCDISTSIEKLKKYYTPILESSEADYEKRLLDVDVLISMSAQYKKDLDRFLSDFSLDPPSNQFQDKINPIDKDEDAVVLSTVHSAKGLEWKYVFIIHTLDGLFPSYRSVYKIEELEEERRLFYVACTRAKTKLFITMPYAIFGYNAIFQHPSRFIAEIDKNKYEYKLKD